MLLPRFSAGLFCTRRRVMTGGLGDGSAVVWACRLAGLLPGDLDRVFFSESGSVAVEVALKMALQYWINRGIRTRRRFVAFTGGYHGDTAGAMAVSDAMHGELRAVLPGHDRVALPQDEASRAAFDRLLTQRGDAIAAILVQPVA